MAKPKTDRAREREVNIAIMSTMFKVPFFAAGMVRITPVVWDDTVPTWCTDGTAIRANRAFTDGLPEEVLPTVLCHEVMHPLMGHNWRAPEECLTDPALWDLWNQAADHEINLALKEFSAGVMVKGLADPFPFPQPESAYCADPRFAGMAAERIYDKLKAERKPGGSGGKPGQGQGQGQPKPGNAPGQPAPHSMPAFGQMAMPPAAPSPAQVQAAKQSQVEWQSTAIQSARLAKGQGPLPGGLARFVDGITTCKVSWYELLRSWLREQSADDWDFQTPCMEMSGGDFILPSLRSDKIGRVVFATDTSGSIDKDQLRQFQAEKQGCLDDMRPRVLVDIYCDAKIQSVSEYVPGDTITREAPGGGGTNFRPVFEYCAKLDEIPKCLVYLTDLAGDFPTEPPPYPVVWVCYGSGEKSAPFGEVIKVDEI